MDIKQIKENKLEPFFLFFDSLNEKQNSNWIFKMEGHLKIQLTMLQ